VKRGQQLPVRAFYNICCVTNETIELALKNVSRTEKNRRKYRHKETAPCPYQGAAFFYTDLVQRKKKSDLKIAKARPLVYSTGTDIQRAKNYKTEQ
jgi:hypothetical protein